MNTKRRENDTREILRSYYESTRRDDEFEPSWVHPFFAPVLADAPLDPLHDSAARALRKGKITRESWLGQLRVVDRDGWKVGTTTWIFLRRRRCTPMAYKGWTIISATFANYTFWMAYNEEHPVGMSTFSDESIGPCLSLGEVKNIIDEYTVESGGAR